MQLEHPIDVMSLIHKAIRAEARHTRRAAEQLEMGGSFKTFTQVFYRWAMALEYHEETEYKYIMPHLPPSPPAEHNEVGHRALLEGLEELQVTLHEELGRMVVIPRTQRQLFGKVISLLVVQADLLEEEEATVLPMLRREIDEAQQLEMARRLLFDLDADEPYWVLDWIAEHLSDTERSALAGLAVRLDEPSYADSSLCAEMAVSDDEAATDQESAPSVDDASFEHPIDVMYLIHRALSAEAWHTEVIAERLIIGEDAQPFQHAFNGWMQALTFHAEMEDAYMTPRLPQSTQTQENEEAHARLGQRAEEIRRYLQKIDGQPITTRMRRRLYGLVVALRIEQDDHLEEEEEFILPIIRDRLSREDQVQMAARLLLDPEPEMNWVIDWLKHDLTDVERQSLANLTACFDRVEV